ncbi:MAG: PilZ domain-containing protein [Armatimonadetes bacterium]|nr:PilZ domain-containing protein [Armatimonadota bacterium]
MVYTNVKLPEGFVKTLEILRGFLPKGKERKELRTFTIEVPVRRGSEEQQQAERPSVKKPDPDGNRRGERRIGRICAIWYRQENGSFHKAHAVDLAPDGARLILDRKPAAGESLELAFKTLHEEFITVKARVIWASSLPGGIRHVTGVSFDVPAVDRAALAEWIGSLSAN